MPTPAVEAHVPSWVHLSGLDLRQRALDDAGGIMPGDWMADLGGLRQVESVDMIGVGVGGVVHIVHFVEQDGVDSTVRGFSGGVSLTVWRSAGQR
jgi:hypothetical protein